MENTDQWPHQCQTTTRTKRGTPLPHPKARGSAPLGPAPFPTATISSGRSIGAGSQAGVTLRLAQSWGDAASVTATAVKQQACLSAALVEAVRHLGRVPIERHPGLLPALLAGVSVRLESPLPAIRCVSVGGEPCASPIPCIRAHTPQVCAYNRSI